MPLTATSDCAAPAAIGVFDTSIATDNLGDHIIMDAVWDVLRELFGATSHMERVATHRFMSRCEQQSLAGMEFAVVGGTNILKSHMFIRANWRLRPQDAFFLRNVVLLGVGWQQYQGSLDFLSKALLGRILSRKFIHSVRDEYTLGKLARQFPKTLYTACPTLWRLTPAKCATIPTRRAPGVIVSLTYYRPSPLDADLISLLRGSYQSVYFWCQMREDLQYLRSLAVGAGLPVIADLDSYNRVLADTEVDVIGTRLHGGIRALQYSRRALILSVDNRAAELARSSGMPVVERSDLAAIRDWIDGSDPVSISLPWDAIAAWKGQFPGVL